MRVHHQPLTMSEVWNLHLWRLAWDGNDVWDPRGTPQALFIDFEFPDVADPRNLQFKYRSTSTVSGLSAWEPDDFIRQVVQPSAADIWTFAQSARVLYRDPHPPGTVLKAGDAITIKAITRHRFAGGTIYVWNPYDKGNSSAFFPEAARDDTTGISTFVVVLSDWMSSGFHFKLMRREPSGNQVWEPNASNRVWRPCDGRSLWIKSGQCDVRNQPLALTAVQLEILLPSTLRPPTLILEDVAEGLQFPVDASSTLPYPSSALFNIATYQPSIYPEAAYTIQITAGQGEGPPITRAFPGNPADVTQISRFALGASAWLADFPIIAASVQLVIQPQVRSSFTAGLSVQVSLGNSVVYESIAAQRTSGGSWTASPTVAQGITTRLQLIPAQGTEPKPYDWIDMGRYFTPPRAATTLFTTEGVFGLTTRGKTLFAEPSNRRTAMEAAFGVPIVGSDVFAVGEMPHGATIVGQDVYFVIHAPHAVWAALVLISDGGTSGSASRQLTPMSLTEDTRYWWCSAPLSSAGPGARYHFLLNDNIEVLDPAARAVIDTGSFEVTVGADPNDASVAWSQVLDVQEVRSIARAAPWQTMGWERLLVYEMHAQRFTDIDPKELAPLDLLVDELKPVSRLGQPGYLQTLPITAIELLPVQEFSSAISWGYDPSFYFAVDGHYGGSLSLARFVDAAHRNGRAVLLDVVYNHSLGSSLMQIAPDVYRNGDYDGDRMNCGHPMVGEFLRQATLHFCYTFAIDGFRFDDTQTIATRCEGGWAFLGMLRGSVRTAASAEGRAWPYCVAENSATSAWDISNPGFGVMDGQWGIDEVYRLRDASYDNWHPGMDDSRSLGDAMKSPTNWGRPFYQVVRFGESHDMVSAQDPGNLRIAARPMNGLGYRLAKALGTLTLLSNGMPMLFMGQEVGETVPFSFDSSAPALNPQLKASAGDNAKVFAWFQQIVELRNDPSQGLQGDANYQTVRTGNRTVAYSCGSNACLFVVVTFGTPDLQQSSAWLGLSGGGAYKEIFNSSWPAFQVSGESAGSNGGYAARIVSGDILSLPYVGAIVLQHV